jgi:hypothetical protein
MKKILLGACALGILFVSCNKKENSITGMANTTAITPKHHNSGHTNSVSASRESKGTKPNSSMYSDGWCRAPKYDCYQFPEDLIVITASAREMLRDAEQNGPEYLLDAFNSSEFDSIAAYMPDEFYTKIMSGDYYLVTGDESNSKVSFMLSTHDNVLFSNMEFSFEIEKEQ